MPTTPLLNTKVQNSCFFLFKRRLKCFHSIGQLGYIMSRSMRFPTICHLKSVDSDEPLQPQFKLRNSKWCSVSSLTIIEYSSD